MDTDLRSTIPVTVEFGPSLGTPLDTDRTREIERRLASELSVLLQRLGLAGEPEVMLQGGNSGRAVQIRVHGELQPYSPDLMKRVWRALAPAGLRNLPETIETANQTRFPDAWFKGYLAGLNSSNDEPGWSSVFEQLVRLVSPGDEADWELVLEYLVRLVLEVIRERPACLIGPAQTSAYLTGESDHLPHSVPSSFSEVLSPVLRSLLDLGVSVEDKSLVLQTSSVGWKLGRSVEDTVEGAFAQLRSSRIEVHVNPRYLKSLVPGEPIREPLSVYAERINEDLRDLFGFMEEGLFFDLGLQLPDLVWMPSPEMREGMIAVKINERLGLPMPGIHPGELLVDATVGWLAALDVPGQPATNPANGNACAVVAEAHKETVERAGYNFWTPHGFVILALASEIRRMADRLLGVEDVEYKLAQLKDAFPELVRAATERYSVGDLTRVLRGLVREGVSIRDMLAILERLLRYEAIPVDSNRYVVFDDRIALEEGTPPESARGWANYREFVRSGLKYYIGRKYAQYYDRLSVYLIDQELEARAEATNGRPADTHAGFIGTEQEAFWDAVWAEVGDVAATRTRPVILTRSSARAAIRELIAPELPDLPVVAYSELPPNVNIEPVGRISLA
jgi:hypothetical protein